ncbi:hypothetical protein FGRMN_10167 [Fusarium graminum]|nr:hypothetical protein FGRMN_10167 [Fusarium graminum]
MFSSNFALPPGFKEEYLSSTTPSVATQDHTSPGIGVQASSSGPNNDRMPPIHLLNYPLPDDHPCNEGTQEPCLYPPPEQVSPTSCLEDSPATCRQESLAGDSPWSAQEENPLDPWPLYEPMEDNEPTSAHPPYGTEPGYEYRLSFSSGGSDTKHSIEIQNPNADGHTSRDHARYYGEQLASNPCFSHPANFYQDGSPSYKATGPSRVRPHPYSRSVAYSTSYGSGTSAGYLENDLHQNRNTRHIAPKQLYCLGCRAEMERLGLFSAARRASRHFFDGEVSFIESKYCTRCGHRLHESQAQYHCYGDSYRVTLKQEERTREDGMFVRENKDSQTLASGGFTRYAQADAAERRFDGDIW